MASEAESGSSEQLTPLQDLISLVGRRALVTGAAQGIGKAIAHRLAEAGASVLIGDVDETGAADTADAIGAATGSQTISVRLDVTDPESVRAAADLAVAKFGGLDTWVNNAGIYPPTGPIESADVDTFDRVVEVNVRGVFLGCREAAKRFDGPGVIVNVSSITTLRATKASSAYVTTKTAVTGLTRAAALDLGKRQIRVIAVAPGFVETPGTRQAAGGFDDHGLDFKAMAAANPLHRAATGDDIARVVLFCVSDLAANVTGALIVADGGSTC